MKNTLKKIFRSVKAFLKAILSKSFWVEFFTEKLPLILKATWLFMSFFLLVSLILLKKIVLLLERIPLIKYPIKFIFSLVKAKTSKLFNRLTNWLDSLSGSSGVKRSYLIALAYGNMKLKKTRAFITIGGMAIGIGIIVFLVSLGYGLEKLVITQVAKLEDLKMADVVAGESGALKIDNEILKKITTIANVEEVMPIVSIVGRVNFKTAVTDVLAYAVPQEYFNYSQIKPMEGQLFDDKDFDADRLIENRVAGAETEIMLATLGSQVSEAKVVFNLEPDKQVIVREEQTTSSKILGYTKRIEGGFIGEQYWGSAFYNETNDEVLNHLILNSSENEEDQAYDEEKNLILNKWLQAKVPIFYKTEEGNFVPELDDLGRPLWVTGWIVSKNAQILDILPVESKVLGESTEATGGAEIETEAAAEATVSSTALFSTVKTATDSGGIEWVELISASDSAQKKETIVNYQNSPNAEVVVSSGLLRLFNLDAKNVIGEKFKASFIVVKTLMPEIENKVLSEEIDYTIVGVVNDDNTPYFYVSLGNLVDLGIVNYSQARIVVGNQNALAKVRSEIETLGFRTSSTVDTVTQIERLFANLRMVLGILGTVALAVAVLGMFNTLTVSLLERTREIGGMKAMGMLSNEVRDLLLAEAMIMGFSGGILGLLLGILFGRILSLVLSLFAVFKGQGLLNMTYMPWPFVVFIFTASFLVGIVTGLYPAKRATKISALNALRYE